MATNQRPPNFKLNMPDAIPEADSSKGSSDESKSTKMAIGIKHSKDDESELNNLLDSASVLKESKMLKSLSKSAIYKQSEEIQIMHSKSDDAAI